MMQSSQHSHNVPKPMALDVNFPKPQPNYAYYAQKHVCKIYITINNQKV